ncbi:hypothetical protein C3B44_09225 [Corynebacterium yudongzhengii]|uniref:Uncharacterized protein n=1 Tax=Corynebacterium yudongzhengii TaxID=2080740 RepID=A0A2U1T8V4_9CORY|nr:hypothetical protein [Corynebacterium yudongzhengii]AWB82508.1 hypothetical protein C3B44_09225 [Corynebacterium yudongzhengii]PWC02436.1 hypothetical protein DF222_02045 [Corynebacterium yudongzhengii]
MSSLRVVLVLWALSALVILALGAVLNLAAEHTNHQRLDTYRQEFFAFSQAREGHSAGDVVHEFLSREIPPADMLLAGLIDDHLVYLPVTGFSGRAVDPQVLLDNPAALSPTVSTHRVVVRDERGGQAELIIGVDNSPARSTVTTAILTAGVLLTAQAAVITAVLGTTRRREPPGRCRCSRTR